jgi:hypothetical protein
VIRFRCECGRELVSDAGKAGALGICPACRRTMTVPSSETAEARLTPVEGAVGVCAGPRADAIDLPAVGGGVSVETENLFALADAVEEAESVRDLSEEDLAVIRHKAWRAMFLGLVGLAIVVTSPFAIYYGLDALRRMWVAKGQRGGAIDWFEDREKALGGICLGGLGLLFWPCLLGLAYLCQGV